MRMTGLLPLVALLALVPATAGWGARPGPLRSAYRRHTARPLAVRLSSEEGPRTAEQGMEGARAGEALGPPGSPGAVDVRSDDGVEGEGEAEEDLATYLEDSDVARTVWVIDMDRTDGSRERLQVLFDSRGKAIWEGTGIPRSGTWSLRPDRFLFTREMAAGVLGFKETYVASPEVGADDGLKLTIKGLCRGWAYFAPALKIGDFTATRKRTDVGE